MDLNEVEILLVEDNPNDAELATRALTRNNIANRLLHVRDGEEALEYIFGTGRYVDHNPAIYPKVVLLDLKLPKIDGLEVLRRIRANEITKMMPVVVLTSSQEESDRIGSYQIGANSFVVKPMEFEDFSRAIVELGMYWLLINRPPK
jgi:two-component system response regulator